MAALDIAVCTLAGIATASSGAYTNKNHITSQVLRLGALAGAIKSGVRGFCIFVSLHTSSPSTLTLKFLLLSWGLTFFVTNAVAQRIMWPGELRAILISAPNSNSLVVPEGLLVAAVAGAAGGPLWFGSINLWGSERRYISIHGETTLFLTDLSARAGIRQFIQPLEQSEKQKVAKVKMVSLASVMTWDIGSALIFVKVASNWGKYYQILRHHNDGN